MNGGIARLDAEGRFAPVDDPTHWLPTPGDPGLRLVLRLYHPDPALVAAPATLVPPTIRRLGDCAR